MDTAPSADRSQPIDFFPFAYALFDDNLAIHCWYCLDDGNKHKRCTGCRRAMFCDQNCQLLAWKDHKFECRGIRANGGNVPDIEVRLLGRIMARHKAILCGMDKKDPNFYKDRQSRRNIMDIWAHTKKIEQDEYAMRKFEDIYTRLGNFYDPKALLSRDLVFELHCRDFINRHAISDKHYLREIGKGLYLDLCAYDHSCRPNTVYSCRSFIATLRPLHSRVNILDRSITFYSYIDLLCTKQDRRKLLNDTWYFNCECERCVDQSEHILTSMLCPHCPAEAGPTRLCPFGQSDYKDEQTQLITCPKCGAKLAQHTVVEAIAAMRFINDMLEKNDFERMERTKAIQILEDLLDQFQMILPAVNVYFCKIVQALLPHIDQDNGRLLELHLMVEECIRQCYPTNHPALAFHLRNIGIFAKAYEYRFGGRELIQLVTSFCQMHAEWSLPLQLQSALARIWQNDFVKNKQNDHEMAKRYLSEALAMFEFVMGKDHSLSVVTKEILEEMERGRGEIVRKEEEKQRGERKKKHRKKNEERKREEEKESEEEEGRATGKRGKRKEKKMGKGRRKEEGKKEEVEDKKEEEEKGKKEEERKEEKEGKREKEEKEEEKDKKEEERKEEEEDKKGRKEGGSASAGIQLEINAPPEDEDGTGRTADEHIVTALVGLSISRASEEKSLDEEEAEGSPVTMIEVEESLRLKELQVGGVGSSSSRPESVQSLSPNANNYSDGGVRKKLEQQKKGTRRRRRTPKPPKPNGGEEEEKSEASVMEEPKKRAGEGR